MTVEELYNKYLKKDYSGDITLDMVSLTQLPGARPVFKVKFTDNLKATTVLTRKNNLTGQWYVQYYEKQDFYPKLKPVLELYKKEKLRKFLSED